MSEEFYNLKKINKADPKNETVLKYIIGGRRIGKTYWKTKDVIQRYERSGEKTFWLRNKKEEFLDPSFFANFCADGKKDGWIPEEFDGRKDGIYNDITPDADCIIRFASVSTYSNMRGSAHPEVYEIVLDEMIPEDGRFHKACRKVLPSMWDTIINAKNGSQITVLSNFITITNPYFASQRIYPKKGVDVTMFHDKGTLIEICRGYKHNVVADSPGERMKASFGYDGYDVPNDPMATLISQARGYQTNYTFETKNGCYGLNRDGDTYYWYNSKPKALMRTFDNDLISKTTSSVTSAEKRTLKDAFYESRMRFTTVNCMFDVTEMMV